MTREEKYSWGLGLIELNIKDIEKSPSEQPEQDRGFIKLTVRNSNGRPYYSIIYLEFDDNGVGHDFEGYSSYSLDVISDYLKKYFMPSAQPEPGEWVEDEQQLHVEKTYHCSKCGYPAWGVTEKTKYCPGCGTYMGGEPG